MEKFNILNVSPGITLYRPPSFLPHMPHASFKPKDVPSPLHPSCVSVSPSSVAYALSAMLFPPTQPHMSELDFSLRALSKCSLLHQPFSEPVFVPRSLSVMKFHKGIWTHSTSCTRPVRILTPPH